VSIFTAMRIPGLGRLPDYLGLVRFSHTLFAMPFALASMVWAAEGLPSARVFLLIVLAMVTCRNAAMAFNRLVDAAFDAENPRTARRHLPAGILSRRQVIAFFALNAAAFVAVAAAINGLAFALAIPALAAVCGFDKAKGLHSMVVRLGIPGSLALSKVLHGAMWLVLLALGWRGGLGLPFQASLAMVGLLLLYVHLFRRSASLDALNQDFFLANIAVSVCLMAGIVGQWLP
jgi:4-hydroxybenzoate polyprenyltransferase